MIYGYCRLSTSEGAVDATGNPLQVFLHQEEELIKRGVKPENIYKERISGTREAKPILTKLLNTCEEGSTIIVYELSRISRSLKDFTKTVEIIKEKRLRLEIIMNNLTIDFSKDEVDPFTEFFMNLIVAISSLEVNVLRERIKSGLRATDKRVGRPPITKEKLEEDAVFLKYYLKWKNKEINLSEMARLYGHSRKNCREKIRIYENAKDQ